MPELPPKEHPSINPKDGSIAGSNGTVIAQKSRRSALLLSLSATPALAICLLASHQAWRLNDYVHHESDFAISFGLGFALVSLAAFWAAWGPLRVFTRTVLSTLLTILAALSMASFVFIKGPTPNEVVISLAIGLACGFQWLAMVIFLVLLGMFLQIRIDLPHADHRSLRETTQFSIRQMVFWTTAVAITLAISRWLVSAWAPSGFNFQEWPRFAMLFLMILSFHIAIAFLGVWAILCQTGLLLRLGVASMSVVLLTGLEYAALELLIGGPGSGDPLFIWLNVSSCLCLSIHLVIVRCCGYRVVIDSKRLPFREFVT